MTVISNLQLIQLKLILCCLKHNDNQHEQMIFENHFRSNRHRNSGVGSASPHFIISKPLRFVSGFGLFVCSEMPNILCQTNTFIASARALIFFGYGKSGQFKRKLSNCMQHKSEKIKTSNR